MPSKPKVFLSHSSKSAYATLVRDGLAQALEAKFEVLLDRDRLEPGDDWRAKLHRWLVTCDGGVILFSREAVGSGDQPGSDWIRKEATILTLRQALNPKILVVPALLGDVAPEDTRLNGFSALGLEAIQFARLPTTGTSEAEAKDLIQQIVKRFDVLTVPSHSDEMGEWVRDAAVLLKSVDSLHLQAAFEKLNICDEDLSHDQQYMTLAYHLLCLGLEKATEGLGFLGKSLTQQQRRDLGALVIPTWVSEEVARWILPVTRRPEPARFLAINTTTQEIAEHYLRRATCGSSNVTMVRATGVTGEDFVEDSLQNLDLAFRHALQIGKGGSPDLIAKACRAAPDAFFALLGRGAQHKEVLDRLRARYPKVTFVLISGLEFPQLDEVVKITPALDQSSEDNALVAIGRARQALRLQEDSDGGDAQDDR